MNISLLQDPNLCVQCLLNRDPKVAFKNASNLGCTSKIFAFINAIAFFKNMVQVIEPNHPFLTLNKEKLEAIKGTFKEKYFTLRKMFLIKNERFSETAFTFKEDELASISNDIMRFRSKNNELASPELLMEKSPCVARSDKYFAINYRTDSNVYIYKLEEKDLLRKYYVKGRICQVAIQDNLLCVVEKLNDRRNLRVFNLDLPQEHNTHIITLLSSSKFDQPTPICFGKECLLYMSKDWAQSEISALPMSYLHNPLEFLDIPWMGLDYSPEGTSFFFPKGNDICKIIFHEKSFDLFKITLDGEELKKTTIVKGVVIPRLFDEFLCDVCFQDDRLFFAFQNSNDRTRIFSYDFVLDLVKEVDTIYGFAEHNSKFLDTTDKICFLVKGFACGKGNTELVRSHLSTIRYGKL